MSAQVIYHGVCAQPPHRDFIDAHLIPVVREVVGHGFADFEVIVIRPVQVRMSDTRFDEIVSEAVATSHPGVIVARKGYFDDAVHDGYVLVFVESTVGATWTYLTKGTLEQSPRRAESQVRDLYLAFLNKVLRKIIVGFREDLVVAGGT